MRARSSRCAWGSRQASASNHQRLTVCTSGVTSPCSRACSNAASRSSSYRWRMSPSALAASTARIAVGVQAGRGRTSGCLACGAVISSSPVGRRFAQHKRVRRQTAATSRSRRASLWVTSRGPASRCARQTVEATAANCCASRQRPDHAGAGAQIPQPASRSDVTRASHRGAVADCFRCGWRWVAARGTALARRARAAAPRRRAYGGAGTRSGRCCGRPTLVATMRSVPLTYAELADSIAAERAVEAKVSCWDAASSRGRRHRL